MMLRAQLKIVFLQKHNYANFCLDFAHAKTDTIPWACSKLKKSLLESFCLEANKYSLYVKDTFSERQIRHVNKIFCGPQEPVWIKLHRIWIIFFVMMQAIHWYVNHCAFVDDFLCAWDLIFFGALP